MGQRGTKERMHVPGCGARAAALWGVKGVCVCTGRVCCAPGDAARATAAATAASVAKRPTAQISSGPAQSARCRQQQGAWQSFKATQTYSSAWPSSPMPTSSGLASSCSSLASRSLSSLLAMLLLLSLEENDRSSQKR